MTSLFPLRGRVIRHLPIEPFRHDYIPIGAVVEATADRNVVRDPANGSTMNQAIFNKYHVAHWESENRATPADVSSPDFPGYVLLNKKVKVLDVKVSHYCEHNPFLVGMVCDAYKSLLTQKIFLRDPKDNTLWWAGKYQGTFVDGKDAADKETGTCTVDVLEDTELSVKSLAGSMDSAEIVADRTYTQSELATLLGQASRMLPVGSKLGGLSASDFAFRAGQQSAIEHFANVIGLQRRFVIGSKTIEG